jgi:cell division protein FtsZ
MISQIADLTGADASVVALDTDSRLLAETRATTKLQIGAAHTGGLGTGGDINLGRLSAEDDIEIIRSVFSNDPQLVVMVVGLGGGTGTGAAPIVLKAAHDAGAMTICFAALPFQFEGKQRDEQATQGVAKLRDHANALVLVPNDQLFELIGDASVAQTFERADRVVGEAICSLWRVISVPSYFNPDFADVQAMLTHCGGACRMGYGSASGANRADKAMRILTEGALLEGGRLLESARVAMITVAGGNDLSMQEVRQIHTQLTARFSEGCKVLFGTVIDEGMRDALTVAVLLSEEWISQSMKALKSTPLFLDDERVLSGKAKVKSGDEQTSLSFEAPVYARFKGSEPTLIDGEDMDVPTFIRRRIAIER